MNMDEFEWHKGYSDGEHHIPEYMLGGLKRYIMHGLAPGHFLSAVICNNLFGAVGHADKANLKHLPAYVIAGAVRRLWRSGWRWVAGTVR